MPVSIPTILYKSSFFSISSPAFFIPYFFDQRYINTSRWYVIVVLIYISLMISEIEHLSFTCWLLHVFFRKMFIHVLYPFFFLFVFMLLSYMSSLYILAINPLQNICLANVFPHFIGHLFISLYVPFVIQKLFSLTQSHLSILAFVTYALGVISKKKSLPRPQSLCFVLGIL